MRRSVVPSIVWLAVAFLVVGVSMRPVEPLAAASPSFLLASVESVEAASWPRFRGPEGRGRSDSLSYPTEWGTERGVAWKVDVPGGGWSSPVVAGGRVFVTTATHPDYDGPVGFRGGVQRMADTGKKPEGPMTFEVRCLREEDGSLEWRREVARAEPDFGIHPSNTFATETPAFEDGRLFVYFGAIGLVVALDEEGREIWRADIGAYPTSSGFGTGSSVAVRGGRVFVQCDNDRDSFIVAFAAEDGTELWRAERPRGTAWSTPVVWPTEAGERVVACGPDNVTAYDPATGEVAWQIRGVGGSFSASPVFDGERLYAGNSGPMVCGPLFAVAPETSGPVSMKEMPDALAWVEGRSGPGLGSPVLGDGLLFVFASPGIVACHDATTGERVWQKRLPGSPSIVASPWIAGDRLFALAEDGTTFVLRAGREYELLARNELPGLYWATPSIAGDSLLIREAGALWCIRAEAEAAGVDGGTRRARREI